MDDSILANTEDPAGFVEVHAGVPADLAWNLVHHRPVVICVSGLPIVSWFRHRSPIGHSLFWEQWYFLQRLQLKSFSEYRKGEKRRGILNHLSSQYVLFNSGVLLFTSQLVRVAAFAK